MKDGKILTSSEERIERWRVHFQELLRPEDNSNRKQPLTAPQNPPHNQAYENVCTDPPSRDEVIKAIQVLKNHKSPGIDGIPAELLKALPEVAVDELHSVITEGWDNEYIPDDWKTSIIVPIFKKGDLMDCKNYRGISLIPIAAKLFAVILLNRFRDTRNSRTRPNQAGFRPGMGCCDQIFSL